MRASDEPTGSWPAPFRARARRMDLYLDARNAAKILAARADGAAEASLDLNLTRRPVRITSDSVLVDKHAIPLDGLEAIVQKPRKVFRHSADDSWEPVEIFDDAHYQLVPTSGSPTAEIDGVQMHLTRVDPFEWARRAVATVVRGGHRVFDSCGGLGYMAIHAARLGARDVRSTEISSGMLHLRKHNPWSAQESGLPIRLEQEDAMRAIARLGSASVDAMIHDPPRASLSPELYSQSFYARAFAVLVPGGRMFHYTGRPYTRGRGRDFVGGVRDRLQRAGFHVRPISELDGFVATRVR